MTPECSRLSARLADINDRAERTPPAADLAAIAAELRAIRAYMNGSSSTPGAARDRIREALLVFQQQGTLGDAQQARLVCWGTTLANPDAPMLMEDNKLFPELLDQVHQFRGEPKPYRRCWRGLLDGYLTYDPDAGTGGRANWAMLRDYLWSNRDVTSGPGFRPDWAATIAEHSNLLTTDPCSRYGEALFKGDASAIEALRNDLGITDASWVMRALVEAQVSTAISLSDVELREIMPRLVTLLEQHPILQDPGLARVLDRYVRCTTSEPSASLREHTVSRWGNPWLERNEPKWGVVTPEARKMVADWLKLEFIETFFSLLSADQMNDQRRLRFWKRYVSEIDDMYFALGDTAFRNPSPDFKNARKQMAGRLLRLDKSGAPTNNAFVMSIRNHVFVEFGDKGNALYVFDRDSLPFDLSRSWVAADRSALKSHRHAGRLVHIDSTWQTWEQKCEKTIRDLTGVRPDGAPARSAPSKRDYGSQVVSEVAKPNPGVLETAVTKSAAEIIAFLASRRVSHIDHRDKGGSFWVYAPQHGGDLPGLLRSWGFEWSARRDAWYWKQL